MEWVFLLLLLEIAGSLWAVSSKLGDVIRLLKELHDQAIEVSADTNEISQNTRDGRRG